MNAEHETQEKLYYYLHLLSAPSVVVSAPSVVVSAPSVVVSAAGSSLD